MYDEVAMLVKLLRYISGFSAKINTKKEEKSSEKQCHI